VGDPRLAPILKNMNKQYLGKDFSGKSTNGEALEKLSVETIDTMAELNMPMCARYMHRALQREHKVKHWARLQYGLFLKGAGLSLDEALLFWESHFTKVMSHDQFMKGYSYAIRHSYGKEGSALNAIIITQQ
jgi:DNA primase large subunit